MLPESVRDTIKMLVNSVDCDAETREWILSALNGPKHPLSIAETCRRLGISKRTFHRYEREGKFSRISPKRINRKRVVCLASDVEAEREAMLQKGVRV